MIIPQQFSARFITETFYLDYLRSDRLNVINQGQCYDWAYFGHRLFGAELWARSGHAWIRVDNSFYDSETDDNGSPSWEELKCCIRSPRNELPQAMSLEEFKLFWTQYSSRANRNHWVSELEPRLQKALGARYSELTPIL